jgi:hypothetical protein
MRTYIQLVIGASFCSTLLTCFDASSQTRSRSSAGLPAIKSADKKLRLINNVQTPFFTDTSNLKPGVPFKILIMGNSLSFHGKSPKIGWTHPSGMAATSMQNDYAHLLFKKIEGKIKMRVDLRIASLVQFERHLNSFDLKSLDTLRNYNADLIIIQLGENIHLTDLITTKIYKQRLTDLINSFKSNKATIICTTPFFPSTEKNKVVASAVLDTRSFLVDLSHLSLSDPKNLAKNEPHYRGDRAKWQIPGIGVHPGDFGMENIAKEIFVMVNAILPTK